MLSTGAFRTLRWTSVSLSALTSGESRMVVEWFTCVTGTERRWDRWGPKRAKDPSRGQHRRSLLEHPTCADDSYLHTYLVESCSSTDTDQKREAIRFPNDVPGTSCERRG